MDFEKREMISIKAEVLELMDYVASEREGAVREFVKRLEGTLLTYESLSLANRGTFREMFGKDF